jgi:hypothetical protein
MTTTYHAIVQPDGKIEIEAPDLTPGQQVTVTVTPEANAHGEAPNANDGQPMAPKPKRHAADIIAEAGGPLVGKSSDEVFELLRGKHVLDIIAMLPGHRAFKTAEEVDAYIREERDSWGINAAR